MFLQKITIMKNLKFSLMAILFATIATMTAFKSNAQTTQYYQYTGAVDGNFVISSGSASTLLTDGNWGSASSTSFSCDGGSKLCQVIVVTPMGKTPPSKADVEAKVSADYNNTTHAFNSNPLEVRNGQGVLLYTITIETKS